MQKNLRKTSQINSDEIMTAENCVQNSCKQCDCDTDDIFLTGNHNHNHHNINHVVL